MSELEPLPESPREKREAKIRARMLVDVRATLTDILEGFEDAPVRTLRLIEQYAASQREALSALQIEDEPHRSTAREADGMGGMAGMFREIVDMTREAMNRRPVPRVAATDLVTGEVFDVPPTPPVAIRTPRTRRRRATTTQEAP